MLDRDSPFVGNSPLGRTANLGEVALQQLVMAIVAGDPEPGGLVSESALNMRFAFGMAAIRRALARLAATGWVQAEGRKGWRIAPVSAAHLADLQLSRRCLEAYLPDQPPPAALQVELLRRAGIHRANLSGLEPAALLHQERALKHLCLQVMAAPRLRIWLSDTWDLSLRADRHLAMQFGITRPPLPLADLAEALAANDAPEAARLLATMREDFTRRCERALSRSTTPLAPDTQTQVQPIQDPPP